MFLELFIATVQGVNLSKVFKLFSKLGNVGSRLCVCLLVNFIFEPNSFALESTFNSSPFSKSYSQALEDKALKDKSRIYVLWDLESSAESYSSDIDNFFFFQFKGSGKLNYQILENLTLDLKANVLFQGGQAQSRFGDLLPSGPAYLSYGVFNLDVFGNESLELQAGALSQYEVFGNNIFISRRAFPGIGESFKFKYEDFKFKLTAQQVVPTTYTFSTSLVERESTPILNTGTLEASYFKDKWSIGIKGGLFEYSNLPAYVANLSDVYGNTVDGTGNAAVFKFDFNGWLANFDVAFSPTKNTTFRLAVDMLENLDAPLTYNQAQLVQLSAHHLLNKSVGFDLVVSDFFVESDAVPAFFTSRANGQTNRKGFSVEAGIQWVEKKIRLSAGYTVSDLINPDLDRAQRNSDMISINLETAYDLFN